MPSLFPSSRQGLGEKSGEKVKKYFHPPESVIGQHYVSISCYLPCPRSKTLDFAWDTPKNPSFFISGAYGHVRQIYTGLS
jgi:hypothetical protein